MIMRTQQKRRKGEKKKEGNFSKPLPSVSVFRPVLPLFPTTICIDNNNADVSVICQHPLRC